MNSIDKHGIRLTTFFTGVFQARTKQGSTRKQKHKFRVKLIVVIFKIFQFFLVGPIRYQQVFVVSDPNPSYRNKLYVARTCIDTHLASSPVIAA